MGKGEIDGIVINTAGVGADVARRSRDRGLSPGDRIIVTGTLGDHGMAVMATRHGLALDAHAGLGRRADQRPDPRGARVGRRAITAMKDPTRGGVASALHEMATKARVGIVIDEAALPVRPRDARRLRAGRHRSAARRQRGQGGDGGARRRGRRACSRRCARIRSGATRRSSASAPPSARAWSSSTPASAAASSPSPTANCCHAYADHALRVAVLCSHRAPGLLHLLNADPDRGRAYDIVCCVTSETTFAEEVRVERRGVPTRSHDIRAFYDARRAPLGSRDRASAPRSTPRR